jgi:membrane fusion protein, multidrug efflux system
MNRRVLVLLALSVLLAAGPACSKAKATAQKPGPGAAVVPVVTARVTARDVPVQVDVIGTVEPIASVTLKSQVAGMIERVHFKEGDDVRQGDLLFTIDPRPLQAALLQARAALGRDRALLANALAQKARADALVGPGVISRQEYDVAKANVGSLEATVKADQAAIEAAAVQLGYCSIRAPLSGRTGALGAVAGNLVKANDVPVLVTINQIAPLYVTFALPEAHLAAVRRAMEAGPLPVRATAPGDERGPVEGRVALMSNTVDRATGTITLKAEFANADRRLWPGQFVTVRLILGTLPQATVTPALAVQSGQKGPYAYLVRPDGAVEVRWLKLGPTARDLVVVEAGLQPGDEVVTEGQLRLSPGVHVARKAGAPPPPRPPGRPAEAAR